MNARRLGAIGFIVCLTLALAGCGDDEEFTIPNQSEASRAIRAKVESEMEKARLERLAPRMAAAVAGAERAPSATRAEAPAEQSGSAVAKVRPADELYAANCASCHGATGHGDGPLSAGLQPAPAKHADGNYMNALSNDYLFKVVKEGGAAVGKSPTMAPWGTSFSDEEIWGLVRFMRTLAVPAYDGPMP
ncbi:MAG: cytochrome c [Myxococcota bacterium]